MASIKDYVNGPGGTTGADIACNDNLKVSGKVYFLGNAVTGSSDANTGLERNKPLATFAQAITLSTDNDTIVVLASHAETITSAVTVNLASLTVVGEGSGSTTPRFTCGAAIAMFDVTGYGVYMDNLYFPASTAAPTARIRVKAASFFGNALTFESGASDTTRAMSFAVAAGTPTFMLTNSRFVSVAATPAVGFEVLNATTQLIMDNVSFDGGTFGWTDYAFKGSAAVFGLRASNMSFLNGSDVLLPTTSNGLLQINTSTGDSRVDWTP